MSKQTTETTKATKQVLKKVSASQIKLSDKAVGFEFEGKYIGLNQSAHVDGEGEEKTLHTMVIEHNGERIKFLADAGLRMAVADALIQTGEWFKAVKGEKVSIGKGRTMNQWDIFQMVKGE